MKREREKEISLSFSSSISVEQEATRLWYKLFARKQQSSNVTTRDRFCIFEQLRCLFNCSWFALVRRKCIIISLSFTHTYCSSHCCHEIYLYINSPYTDFSHDVIVDRTSKIERFFPLHLVETSVLDCYRKKKKNGKRRVYQRCCCCCFSFSFFLSLSLSFQLWSLLLRPIVHARAVHVNYRSHSMYALHADMWSSQVIVVVVGCCCWLLFLLLLSHSLLALTVFSIRTHFLTVSTFDHTTFRYTVKNGSNEVLWCWKAYDSV